MSFSTSPENSLHSLGGFPARSFHYLRGILRIGDYSALLSCIAGLGCGYQSLDPQVHRRNLGRRIWKIHMTELTHVRLLAVRTVGSQKWIRYLRPIGNANWVAVVISCPAF